MLRFLLKCGPKQHPCAAWQQVSNHFDSFSSRPYSLGLSAAADACQIVLHEACRRRPKSYKAYGSSKEDEPLCDVPGFENDKMELLRHVSFVDCPGDDCICWLLHAQDAVYNATDLCSCSH